MWHLSRNNNDMRTYMTLAVNMPCCMETGPRAWQSFLVIYNYNNSSFKEVSEGYTWGNQTPAQMYLQLSASPVIKNFQRQGFYSNFLSDPQNNSGHRVKKLQLALFLEKLISRKVTFLRSQS